MIAMKGHFDGEKVILPLEAHAVPPGDVIVVFEDATGPASETQAWMTAQESAFAKTWDNDEDALYDTL